MKTFRRSTGKYNHVRVFQPTTPALRQYFMSTGQIPNPRVQKPVETDLERRARIKNTRRQWESVLRQLK